MSNLVTVFLIFIGAAGWVVAGQYRAEVDRLRPPAQITESSMAQTDAYRKALDEAVSGWHKCQELRIEGGQ